jgi:sugar phosphate isomerase/epimerase
LNEIGVQLISVYKECQKDLSGTLLQLHRIGYRKVETFHFGPETGFPFGTPDVRFHGSQPKEFAAALRSAGLRCPSAHFAVLDHPDNWSEAIAALREIGAEYLVIVGITPSGRSESLDGYQWAADQLNKLGETCRQASLRLAFHTHNHDFSVFDGKLAFGELLRLTEPLIVSFEMDCYWVVQAGYDPVALLKASPGRFPLLHVKDRPSDIPHSVTEPGRSVEVGRGAIDWRAIFRAAEESGLKHFFVEQEQFEHPPMESVAVSFDYLRRLRF